MTHGWKPGITRDQDVSLIRADVDTLSSDVESLSSRVETLELGRHIWHHADRPRNVAHRGYSAVAPENTLAAYRKASEAGFWGAETDIQLSADGHWVCIHDSTVDRTTDGTGTVASMTLAQLKQLDAGSWKGSEFAGEQIPTLEEYLFTCYVGGLVPYIEVKNGTYSDEELEKIITAVKDLGIVNQTVIISFDMPILQRIRSMNKEIVLGFASSSLTDTLVNSVKALGNAFYDKGGVPTVEEMEIARGHGVSVEVWTINSASEALTCFERGVGAITTDSLASIKDLIVT